MFVYLASTLSTVAFYTNLPITILSELSGFGYLPFTRAIFPALQKLTHMFTTGLEKNLGKIEYAISGEIGVRQTSGNLLKSGGRH